MTINLRWRFNSTKKCDAVNEVTSLSIKGLEFEPLLLKESLVGNVISRLCAIQM